MIVSAAQQLPSANELLATLATELQQTLQARGIENPYLVGVATGGVWLANALQQEFELPGKAGVINSGYYRDDLAQSGLHRRLESTRLAKVDGRDIVLVDDVLYTGRTVRATLNELFDYGRPASVLLAVLADRGGRQLPVQADVAAWRGELPTNIDLRLSGPEPLGLALKERG